MARLVNGKDIAKLEFWRKAAFYFNIFGCLSVAGANIFKKDLVPYRTIITVYLLSVIVIWAITILMIFISKRKLVQLTGLYLFALTLALSS